MPETILVVDDEPEIADLVEVYLQNENWCVLKCYTARQALMYIESEDIDLALLDVLLPEADGFALCRKIREAHRYPVIMLTSKDGSQDKITGLTLGADDYITKPFDPLELVARVKAQLRRCNRYDAPAQGKNILSCGDLLLDTTAHSCLLDGQPIPLTPTEFSVLRILCQRKGAVVSSEALFCEIWGEAYFSKSNNPIPVHIRHLREKLNDCTEKPRYIKTVWGVGYKIENESK